MRKYILPGFIAAGALIGLLSAAQDGWGTRVVMMGVGVLFAAPIGAAFAGIKGKRRPLGVSPNGSRLGDVMSPEELAVNYWQDEGHAPLTKPSDALPDRHQFDPDRLR